MHPETLYPKTAQVFSLISQTPIPDQFYLAGGTALALQLGHRKSIDLDFFTDDFPKFELLLQELYALQPNVIHQTDGTLDVLIDTVKVSFLEYTYPVIGEYSQYENVRLASIEDIACMKLSAVSSRGARKDFVDLAMIFQKVPLTDLFALFEKKFSDITYEELHILKSLLYFDDAENEPEVDYLMSIDWKDVREMVTEQVISFQNLKISS